MMPTKDQATDLLTVMCECEHAIPHPLGSAGCTEKVKPSTWRSWKPAPDRYIDRPYPVAEIFDELARHAADKATRDRYKLSAATVRYAAKY